MQRKFILLLALFTITFNCTNANTKQLFGDTKRNSRKTSNYNFESKFNNQLDKQKQIEKLLYRMVAKTSQIKIPGYPGAFNPSIIDDNDGYLLTFRITPEIKTPWVSHIGIVRLNKSLQIASDVQVLNPRINSRSKIPSQAEDARIFSINNDLYLIYNDNETTVNPTSRQRRDMYISKILRTGDKFSLDTPLKIYHETKYPTVLWQKNWTPFVWQNQLMISYTFKPHEVLIVDMDTGLCRPYNESLNPTKWKKGELRGGTPALMIDGEYLTFFHSAIRTKSRVSKNQIMYHYYMGAMTFNSHPPFNVTKMTPAPIIGKGFYTVSNFHKRVVFPGGFVENGNNIYVVYGKDDSEIWVAIINKSLLKASLQPPTFNFN